MHRSAVYCIDLPDDFPESELTQYLAFARKVLVGPHAWTEFGGASNLIGWRYRACYEDWQLYKYSLAKHDSPDHEELYRRERSLFGMFASGVSCIDSTVYSLAALASHPSVLAIPFGHTEQRRCGPAALRGWVAPHATAARLTETLDRLLVAEEWSLWVNLRNRMTHRSNLPCIIEVSVGAPSPPSKAIKFAATSSTLAVQADPADFDALHRWLASMLASLLTAGTTLK